MATARGQLSKDSSTPVNERTTRCMAKALVPYRDGAKYIGEYRDSVRHGDGIVYLANGNRVVGEFPMTHSRKIQKFLIRDQFLEGAYPPLSLEH